jgi:hypothetical protein
LIASTDRIPTDLHVLSDHLAPLVTRQAISGVHRATNYRTKLLAGSRCERYWQPISAVFCD